MKSGPDRLLHTLRSHVKDELTRSPDLPLALVGDFNIAPTDADNGDPAVVALDGADPAGLARLAPWLAPGSTVAVLGGASALAARLAGPGGVRHGALSVTAGGAWVIDTPALRALAAHDEMEEAGARVKRVAAQSTCSYIA